MFSFILYFKMLFLLLQNMKFHKIKRHLNWPFISLMSIFEWVLSEY